MFFANIFLNNGITMEDAFNAVIYFSPFIFAQLVITPMFFNAHIFYMVNITYIT